MPTFASDQQASALTKYQIYYLAGFDHRHPRLLMMLGRQALQQMLYMIHRHLNVLKLF